jgi:hypothetical protein
METEQLLHSSPTYPKSAPSTDGRQTLKAALYLAALSAARHHRQRYRKKTIIST